MKWGRGAERSEAVRGNIGVAPPVAGVYARTGFARRDG